MLCRHRCTRILGKLWGLCGLGRSPLQEGGFRSIQFFLLAGRDRGEQNMHLQLKKLTTFGRG